MFTGIVEATGEVRKVVDDEDGRRVRIGAPFEDLEAGQSISVSGACLTVEAFADGEWFEVFLARETLDRTFFDRLAEGTTVNLERAMPADGRFDGHIVQGHVDATAEVVGIEREGGDWTFSFSLPDAQRDYLVEKGSITVDGISLTVAARDDDRFDVAIIPTTYEETTLSEKSVGDPVHLEVDVVAKYVEQLH
ncbi:riboflavin synthase [Haloarcula nitratireducens]|uniref:Riboflavin synthase n=1 Tax=Haloarcula nitratireducens TaxID=2487749 RepID=A0AAW4PDL9_9EURY|nr:riboflavin synthase [Halomicroarcula nitratireducens]MBX0295362.1 riboflavin synthase [Halomicroarcula nitratireducens]